MRIPVVAGNWKMNKTMAEARELVMAMGEELKAIDGVEKVLCPPFVDLQTVGELIEGTSIKLGAQNMYWEVKGAFTGEISPVMLQGLCEYVILGHSERRQYFGETDEGVNRKIHAALAHSLIPIVCVGENLEQNERGETQGFVAGQVRGAFANVSAEQVRGCIVAYEPIWAIGTGRAATAEGANAIIAHAVRATLAELFGQETAAAIRIQYGGSVTPANAAELMSQPDIDGALVGGASLKAGDFVTIVREAGRR